MHPASLSEFLASEAGSALRSRFHEHVLANGALLPESEMDQVLVVKRGRLRVYLTTPERELSLVYLNEGDVFSTHTRAQLQAVQPTVLLMAQRAVIERELAHYPALQRAIISVLAAVLNQAITLIEDLAFHQVRGRIARYLLRCADRQKVAVEAGSAIRLDLSLEEIAALLGTTRQTASTELNALMHAGILTRQGRRHIEICMPDRLQACARENAVSAS
ncbi:Crp/Fnr family transcriptional regulator [Methyloferula stellata]|uniref:Crp/Fnr family transcriptional regulator n=1 Tax=Methyloferula stellata TaxID=876270 RepID=UPI00047BF245|nr:Crp/Fnr family transcriptional regulator [Methyloferula stellata]